MKKKKPHRETEQTTKPAVNTTVDSTIDRQEESSNRMYRDDLEKRREQAVRDGQFKRWP